MFKALMVVQWKWTKWAAMLATLVGFAIPIASAQSVAMARDSYMQEAAYVVGVMQRFAVGYALLAAAVGLAFAVAAWSNDHKGRHIYALSLPVSRSKYAAMRFAAGAIFLLLPTLGVLVGCLIASIIAPIPAGLHAYPIALTLRFLLASGVAFAIFFAIAASTPKAAGLVLGGIASILIVAFILSAAEVKYDLLGHAGSFLFSEPGLLSVFTGRWMLVDV
jgi:hypothetical protein